MRQRRRTRRSRNGWLRKIARNGERGFKDAGDPAILETITGAFKAVAAATIIATDELKKELRNIPGMDDFEDWGARRDQADDPAELPRIEMHPFPRPEHREPDHEDDVSAGIGHPLPELGPWPDPPLEFMPPPDDDGRG
jgi:hypothetical protein